MALSNNEKPFDKITLNTWICDSAASSHMKFNTEGMTNLVEVNEYVKVGNKQEMKVTYKGDFSGNILSKDS